LVTKPPPPVTPYRVLTIHAESLQKDLVWERVSDALAGLERRRIRATLFVHPLGAIREGIDISGRVRELADRGHEIGQHTHYYSHYEVRPDESLSKGTEMTPENIASRLEEDFAYLAACGQVPRGFVSGGWALHPSIFEWLSGRGFAYDCSHRTYRLRYPNPRAVEGDNCPAPHRIGDVFEIPTTAPIADVLRRRRAGRTLVDGTLAYDLFYLHDTDLARAHQRVALRWVVSTARAAAFVSARELASILSERADAS
jgi:peptidoglycan/xylan/chitin deacetylase (PgdA/CDA1 family)